MGPLGSKKTLNLETRIKKALFVYNNKDVPSLRAAGKLFQVHHTTLLRRLHGGVSQSRSHEMQSILTDAEENTLTRWLKAYSIAGAPLTHTLLKELAIHIRRARVTFASSSTPRPFQVSRINDKWIVRFKKRHPEIQTIFARQLEAARKDGASYEVVERWFAQSPRCMRNITTHLQTYTTLMSLDLALVRSRYQRYLPSLIL